LGGHFFVFWPVGCSGAGAAALLGIEGNGGLPARGGAEPTAASAPVPSRPGCLLLRCRHGQWVDQQALFSVCSDPRKDNLRSVDIQPNSVREVDSDITLRLRLARLRVDRHAVGNHSRLFVYIRGQNQLDERRRLGFVCLTPGPTDGQQNYY
jgi:hypothetical protein